MASGQPRIFISYSHADAGFVDALVTRFEADGIEYWRDLKDLVVGDVIDRVISDGIQAHALFLAVLSPASIRSRWVAREIDEASHEVTEGRKVLLPLLVGELTPDELPARLRRFKCADFTRDFESAYRDLRSAVAVHRGRMAGASTPPAAPPTRADNLGERLAVMRASALRLTLSVDRDPALIEAIDVGLAAGRPDLVAEYPAQLALGIDRDAQYKRILDALIERGRLAVAQSLIDRLTLGIDRDAYHRKVVDAARRT